MSNSDQVTKLMQAWEKRDIEAILATLSEDVVYHNIPMPPFKGHDAVRGFAAPFLSQCNAVRFNVLHQTQNADGIVMNERVDEFDLASGKTMSVRVAGIFECNDSGLICQWRDYFDLQEFQSQMAG